MKKLLRKKKRSLVEEDSRAEPKGLQIEESSNVAPVVQRKKQRRLRAAAAATEAQQEEPAEPSSSSTGKRKSDPSTSEVDVETAETETKDMRGVIHLASIPLTMQVQKMRFLFEQFGEIGRVYLAPEDKFRHENRKKMGGNRKVRFTEGWIEFADRRLARRVAQTLNGTIIGGKKRHNFFRDDMWNMRYLPGFKWHMLKEDTIYNQQVRKARLEQLNSQSQRENNFFLEKVHQAKTQKRIDEKRASKGRATTTHNHGALPRNSTADSSRSSTTASAGGMSERILNKLF